MAGLTRERDGLRVPSIVFTKGGGNWLESIADIGCDAVGLDWTIDIGAARSRVGAKVALQGNLDPAVLLSSAAAIRHEAERVLTSFGNGSGHVFNLGHGISQYTPPENVAALIETVRSFSTRFHRRTTPVMRFWRVTSWTYAQLRTLLATYRGMTANTGCRMPKGITICFLNSFLLIRQESWQGISRVAKTSPRC